MLIIQQTTMLKLEINRDDVAKLRNQSLADLSQLIKAGIIKVGQIPIIYPVHNIHVYLYLHHLKQQHSPQSKQQASQFIDQILINKGNIQTDQLDNSSEDSFVLLHDQIIQIILQINPNIINNYSIQYKGKWLQPIHKSLIVKQKNTYGVGNIIKLCICKINNNQSKLTLQESRYLAKYILLPVYFSNTYYDSKAILQAFKRIIKQQHSNNIMQQLSSLFVLFYHTHWTSLYFDNTNLEHVEMQENQLTLMELIHFNIPYPKQLLKSSILLQHIKGLFLFKGQNKSSIHPLCIKIYEKLASCLNQLNDAALTFVKLFNILSCYGSHLIKDVWSSFYILVDSQQQSVYQPHQLIDIILTKLQNHENSNVIKNCLHQLLKNEHSNRIFERFPTIIYGSLIRMLNLGVHYLDCMFHMDSKMYELITSFFLRYINSTQLTTTQLQNNLKWLVEAITSKSNFDHALIALLLIFQKQQRKTTFLTTSIMQNTKDLLANAYSRFPIRKRFQLVDSLLTLISNNINRSEVTINYLFNYLVLINKEYLMAENKLKIKKLLQTYGVIELENWAQKMIEEIKEEITSKVQFSNDSYNLEGLYWKIRKLELYQSIWGIQLKQVSTYYNQLIVSYSQSQYKNIKQRTFIIVLYSIVKDNLISQLNRTNAFVGHLQGVLNSIVFYIEIANKYEQQQMYTMQILQMINCLYYRAYAYNEGQQFKQRQGQRVVLARMLQWAYDNLPNYQIAIQIVINACRARIKVLDQKKQTSKLYLHYEHLFEEKIYQIYQQIIQLQINTKKTNNCSSLSKDKQLRLRVLLTTILTNDSSHVLYKNPLNCSDIGDIVDRYDFENYEETCWMIQSIYCNKAKAALKGQEQARSLVKQLEVLLENMIQNLEYSLSKKEIGALCQCTVTLLFKFAQSNESFSESFVQFGLKLIKCGQSYLLFQRVVALLVTKQLYNNFGEICELNCEKLMPLLIGILSIEQYRGFDSAIYLYKQSMQDTLYKQFKMELQANYQGAVPRFLLTYAFKNILGHNHLTKRNIVFFDQIIHAAFDICMQLVVKEKMFLSGKNKLKLQMWQFLLVFTPISLLTIVDKNKLESLLVRSVECIGHNLISEIRFYSQMFLMRIITDKHCFGYICNEMLEALRSGLQKSIGNMNRTISYIVASGILINHISEFDQSQPHFNVIRNGYVCLYNCLLTYVGSSVAYFRGLTQFFCLSKVSNCLQTKYVLILRQNFLLDIDAKSLIEKLAQIMNEYLCDIKDWEIQRQILRVIPSQNYNVVSNKYYMDILKHFSTELAKINKNLDGFTAYRYIWKKHAASKDEIQEEQEEGRVEEQEEEEIFQRKIDPTLDYLYGQEHHSQLKLMVTSSKSQALIGHLARTGEIFGINQLIVPSAKIIQSDQFKSISVTAQRWLKISDLGGKVGEKVKEESILKALIRYKSEGFQIIKLSKNKQLVSVNGCIDMNLKCLLLLDEQQILSGECLKLIDQQLQVGRHFSLHVQASIFIWSYFKKYVN